MRLDKFIANNSEFSRTDIKKLVKSNRVTVNDSLADDPGMKIKAKSDVIAVDETIIELIGHIYIAMHKPAGYVCALTDADHPTVMDLMSQSSHFIGDKAGWKKIQNADLKIVGRLDKDTTGLLFLTTDGQWNHRIASPGGACTKTYKVKLARNLVKNAAEKFASGMMLEGEKKRTLPAILEAISPTKARVTIREGKYHQVKRMFAATGNKVVKLHREKIGPFSLNEQLPESSFRMLSAPELEQLNRVLSDPEPQ